MKRWIAALMLALVWPVSASATHISMTDMTEPRSGSEMVFFSVEPDVVDVAPGKEAVPDEAQLAIWAAIEERFKQSEVITATGRGTLMQTGVLWQDEKTASMGLVWQGEQTDGTDGCMAAGLTVSLETGMEIELDELFADYEGAIAAMEAIIERDVLDGMSDYMEYADLLPMPTDSYSFNEIGLTVYYPEDRYRYFSGECGSVTFYWHELADYIGEGSPVYALAHPDIPYNTSEIESLCMSGGLSVYMNLELGELLGSIARWYDLADPDYTRDALVYPLERVRGFAAEIPKYAETAEEETPISAVRASRIRFAGLLETGKTTELEILALLGEPQMEQEFDEGAAEDALLVPGRSLYYAVSGNALQLHLDGDGVLACVILRDAMPESLY